MKTYLVIILATAFLAIGAGGGAGPQGDDAIKAAVDSFMTKVTNGESEAALDDLLDKYWYDRADLTKTKATFRNQLMAELSSKETTMGKALPKQYEFLGYKRLGKSIVRLVYIQKFENFFAPWSFTFYRAKDELRMSGINFGESVDDDLKSFTVTEPAR